MPMPLSLSLSLSLFKSVVRACTRSTTLVFDKKSLLLLPKVVERFFSTGLLLLRSFGMLLCDQSGIKKVVFKVFSFDILVRSPNLLCFCSLTFKESLV